MRAFGATQPSVGARMASLALIVESARRAVSRCGAAFESPDEWCSTGCYSGCMTQSISQRELRNDSARILRAVDEGQSFVVTRHERPVAEVVPLHRARVVDLSIVERNFAGSPSLDSAAFMKDIDDAVIQDAEPRA
mgnify:CR=1 FL=1